jgi:hypothetical protein
LKKNTPQQQQQNTYNQNINYIFTKKKKWKNNTSQQQQQNTYIELNFHEKNEEKYIEN